MSCRDRCANLGLELILVFFGIFMTIGFIVTYIIAYHSGHVPAFLPYISNTGQTPPESCVFTFVCAIGTICILMIVCLRYKQLHHYYHSTVPELHCFNVISTVVGILSAIGLLLVGSFQAEQNGVSVVHFIGAFTVFGCGTLYGWIQTGITVRLMRARLTPYVGCCLVLIRFALCLISSVLFIVAIGAPAFRNILEPVLNDSQMDTIHLVSAIAEWTLGFSFMFFFVSFHPDFTRISSDFRVALKYDHHTDITHRHSIISTDSESTPLMI